MDIIIRVVKSFERRILDGCFAELSLVFLCVFFPIDVYSISTYYSICLKKNLSGFILCQKGHGKLCNLCNLLIKFHLCVKRTALGL